MLPAMLVLGKEILYGQSIGVPGLVCGEVIFNTGMTGYQEILTDPSYKNQIINFTYPHIGNVGVNQTDSESDRVWATGIIVKEISTYASNWQANNLLQNFLYQQNIIGIQGIDTRYITKKIRDYGCLNVAIMAGNLNKNMALKALSNFHELKDANLVRNVGVKTIIHLMNKNANYHIGIMDFGVKRSILNLLHKLGCKITVFPHNSVFDDIMAIKLDGILLSNGPGDPTRCVKEVMIIKKLIHSGIPIFGICLGFQLLALALGAKIVKMLFGHHGINHPIKDCKSKKILITNQNHNFTVVDKSLPNIIIPTHYSLFDGSLQGFIHAELPVFGLQGHPEAGPGPSDAKKLFQDFIISIELYKNSNKHH